MTELYLPEIDLVLPPDTEVTYQAATHVAGLVEMRGSLEWTTRMFRKGFCPQLGEDVWARIVTDDGALVLLWKGVRRDCDTAYWSGTDQMMGLLVELGLWNWAEVAFFTMQRDGTFRDIREQVAEW